MLLIASELWSISLSQLVTLADLTLASDHLELAAHRRPAIRLRAAVQRLRESRAVPTLQAAKHACADPAQGASYGLSSTDHKQQPILCLKENRSLISFRPGFHAASSLHQCVRSCSRPDRSGGPWPAAKFTNFEITVIPLGPPRHCTPCLLCYPVDLRCASALILVVGCRFAWCRGGCRGLVPR